MSGHPQSTTIPDRDLSAAMADVRQILNRLSPTNQVLFLEAGKRLAAGDPATTVAINLFVACGVPAGEAAAKARDALSGQREVAS